MMMKGFAAGDVLSFESTVVLTVMPGFVPGIFIRRNPRVSFSTFGRWPDRVRP